MKLWNTLDQREEQRLAFLEILLDIGAKEIFENDLNCSWQHELLDSDWFQWRVDKG